MALTKFQRVKFPVLRLWNRITSNTIKVDIYGVRILGIQFTPKSTADILNEGRDFNPSMRANFNITLFFGVYIFFPKF